MSEERKPFYPFGGPGEWYSLGYKQPKYFDTPPPNYTPPGAGSFVDIFKGKDDEDLVYKTYLLSKYTILTAGFASVIDICLGTQPKVQMVCLFRRVISYTN